MTILSNISFPNSSFVFAPQNAYVSIELYYTLVALFSIFILASWFLDGDVKPFEKLFAAIIAFIFSVSIAMSSFSLALITTTEVGPIVYNGTTQIVVMPIIVMQNGIVLQIISWILVILCFVNIINCVLVLIDYSRIKGVKKGAL